VVGKEPAVPNDHTQGHLLSCHKASASQSRINQSRKSISFAGIPSER
jgi:hypothetical protein